MKSTLSRPNEKKAEIQSTENGDLEDPHAFESVGSILGRMFAQSAAAEEKKTDR
jgi:hypothetical protein